MGRGGARRHSMRAAAGIVGVLVVVLGVVLGVVRADSAAVAGDGGQGGEEVMQPLLRGPRPFYEFTPDFDGFKVNVNLTLEMTPEEAAFAACEMLPEVPLSHCFARLSQTARDARSILFYQWTDLLGQQLSAFGQRKVTIDTHCAVYPPLLQLLMDLMEDDNVETICEVGFGTGHSALAALLSNPHATVHTFDTFVSNTSAVAFHLLQLMFPDRALVGNTGDSALSLASFHRAFPDTRCNVIFLDGDAGDAEHFLHDLEGARKLANETYHRVVVTNIHQIPVSEAWEHSKVRGVVSEKFRQLELEPQLCYAADVDDDGFLYLHFMTCADERESSIERGSFTVGVFPYLDPDNPRIY